MSTLHLHTTHLTLVLQSVEQTRAMIDALSPEDRAQVSPVWLARLDALTTADPWMTGFSVMLRESETTVGFAGFKGPPSAEGMVEIAYSIDAEHRGKGYATEAAQALTAFAFGTGVVRVVWAHTLPEPNASTRVLTKCGFHKVGEVIDPEDGLVWQWFKDIDAPINTEAALGST